MTRLWPNGSETIPRVSSEWGYRIHPISGVRSLHAGIDLVGFTYVCAVSSGVVVFAAYNGGAGNEIRVNHDDGTHSRYYHNKSFLVGVGQRVNPGTRLAVMGTTGSSTGVHCHLQTHPSPGATSVNPRGFIDGSSTAGGGSLALIDVIGTDYVKRLQVALNLEPDGVVGPATIKALQAKIGTAQDGQFGANSIKALQTFVGAGSDGIWGTQTTGKFREAIDAGRFGAAGNINTDLGPAYVTELQKQLGVNPDGVAGPATISALQAKIGAAVDGQIGPDTIKKLQAYTGATPDGIWGNGTILSIKATIDAGLFRNVATPPVTPPVTPPAGAVTRTAKDALPVNKRSKPTTKVAVIEPIIDGGATVEVTGFAHGEAITGNDIWFRLKDNNWAWSGGFTSQATSDLTEITVELPVDPALPEGYVYGIDIAWPQTALFDWPKVAEKNKFVIIKAGGAEDGIYGPAQLCDQHLAGVRSVGIRAGFYFFNNGALNVKAQADKFIEVLKPRLQPGDLVALDVEPDGPTVPQFTPAQALEFVDYVYEATGVRSFIYINRTTMADPGWASVAAAGYPLWLAVLNGLASSLATTTTNWEKADIVQFEVGRIEGYPGDIDRNYAVTASLDEYGFVAFPSEETPEEPEEPGTPVDPALEARVESLEARVADLEAANETLVSTVEDFKVTYVARAKFKPLQEALEQVKEALDNIIEEG